MNRLGRRTGTVAGALLLPPIASLLTAPAHAGSRQDATVLMSDDPAGRKNQDAWGYADAVVSGDTIYLSGVVVGLRDDGTSLETAYTRGFERIGKILERAGASWDDVVELTSYHTDLTMQMPAIIAVKHRFMKPPAPAWTAIEVSRLIPDRGITEIRVIAKLSKK